MGSLAKRHPNTRLARLAIACVLALSVSATLAEAGAWTSMGPYGVFYPQAIAVAPSDPNVVYLGTQGSEKLYRSVDAGSTWQHVGASAGTDVRNIVVSPSDPDTVYVGSFQEGIFKSPDGGATWTPTNAGLPSNLSVYALTLDPSNPLTIYAGVDRGLYKSLDGGSSWNPIQSGLPTLPINAIQVDPSNSLVVYASSAASGLFKSTDGGATWTFIGGGRSVLLIDPLRPSTIYAGGYGGLSKSMDSGATWTYLDAGLSSELVGGAISQSNPEVLYLAAVNGIARTTDGGANWERLETGLQTVQYTTISLNPFDPSNVYVGERTHVFRTHDSGAHWDDTRSGLVDVWIGAIAVDATHQVLAGQYGLYTLTSTGWVYSDIRSGGILVTSLAASPSDPLRLYAGTPSGQAFRTLDGGHSWETVPVAPLGYNPSLLIDPSDPSIVYVAGGRIQKSIDGGASWAYADAGLPVAGISALAATSTPGTLYAGTQSEVFKSVDYGASWTNVTNGIDSNIRALAVWPGSSTTLFAGTANGIFRTDDGGTSWTPLSSGSSGQVKQLVIDPTAPITVYFSGEDGVYASADAGGNWTLIGSPSFSTTIYGLTVDQAGAGLLFAATTTGVQTYTRSCGDPGVVCGSIGPAGGSLLDSAASVTIDVPPGAVGTPTTFSITGGSGQSAFGLGDTNGRLASVVTLGPVGLHFDTPVTLTIGWSDVDDDGIVDGTSLQEDTLEVFQDGQQLAGTVACATQTCSPTVCCDRTANRWTVQVAHFSEYALVGALPCTPMAAGSKLKISKVPPPAGDDALTLSGAFTLVPPVGPTLNPLANGLEIRLLDGDSSVIDVDVPAGAYSATSKTGWKENGSGTVWTFINATPTTTGGIFKVVLKDKSKKVPGLVTVQVNGKKGAYPVGAASEVNVVLPDTGQCFSATWPNVFPVAPSCRQLGTTLKCK